MQTFNKNIEFTFDFKKKDPKITLNLPFFNNINCSYLQAVNLILSTSL